MATSKEKKIQLSLVIPVYNRPIEIDELLKSLCDQTARDFEVIIVEDGSTLTCEKEVNKYKIALNISYFSKENSGPGLSRNYGADRARGNYIVFLDSDCILPPQYIQTVSSRLTEKHIDAFGGPDKADESFSVLQKSINYAMTSFLTTGGIRGGGEKLDKFYPRSFNMGYSREVFDKTGGFSGMRFGEDIDMSIRIIKSGFKTELIKEAYVYHKRRTNFRAFFKQVFNSGIARINLYKRHPDSLKIVHTFPSIFLIGVVLIILLSMLASPYFLTPLLLYTLLICIDSSIRNKSVPVGFVSILACYIQLCAYGAGFLSGYWKRILFSKSEYSAFNDSFYD